MAVSINSLAWEAFIPEEMTSYAAAIATMTAVSLTTFTAAV